MQEGRGSGGGVGWQAAVTRGDERHAVSDCLGFQRRCSLAAAGSCECYRACYKLQQLRRHSAGSKQWTSRRVAAGGGAAARTAADHSPSSQQRTAEHHDEEDEGHHHGVGGQLLAEALRQGSGKQQAGRLSGATCRPGAMRRGLVGPCRRAIAAARTCQKPTFFPFPLLL